MACAGLLWLVPGLLVMHIGPLGGEKPWCLETSLQLKSSAEPVTAAVKRTIWNLSLANIQAFGFFFSFGEHLCVSWRWTESCGWRKTPLSIPSRSYFSCFAQLLWVNSLSVMSALLWWNLLLQHLDLLKHFSKLCLESFLFFFLFPYPLPFSVKALSRDQQICNPDLHYPMLGLWDFLLQRLEPGSKLIEKKDVTIFSRYESNMEYMGTPRTGL